MSSLFVKSKNYEEIFTKIENFDFIICRKQQNHKEFNELCVDGVYNNKLRK